MKKAFALLLLFCLPALGQVKPDPDKVDTPIATEPFELAGLQVKPQYPGGMSAFYEMVSENLRTPAIEPENDITLKVYITFVIEKDGSLSDIKVIRDAGYGMGQEAKRVIALSEKWSPGIIDGKPVRARYTLPITVNIKGTKKKEKPVKEE